MTRTVVVLLIVCAMLVTDCDSWRRGRRFFRRVARIAESAVKSAAKSAVRNYVVGTVVGKRDALCADLLTPDQVQQLATDLKNSCDEIPVNLATDGLNFEEVKDVFTQSDADGDGKLLKAELTAFSAAIQTTAACAAAEADDKP
ncbi:hypothetical protein V1264_024099 [Littorina saxatilis]